MRYLAGGHGDDLFDHTVGIGQRVLGLVRFLVILIHIVGGFGLDERLVLERYVLGLGSDGLVRLELGIGTSTFVLKAMVPPYAHRTRGGRIHASDR